MRTVVAEKFGDAERVKAMDAATVKATFDAFTAGIDLKKIAAKDSAPAKPASPGSAFAKKLGDGAESGDRPRVIEGGKHKDAYNSRVEFLNKTPQEKMALASQGKLSA
jgi:hypothetical protein